MKQPLYRRIRALRLQKGFTQSDFARKLGYKSVSSYHSFEKGKKKRSISIEQARIIADALNVSLDELFFDDGLRETRNKDDDSEEKPARQKKAVAHQK